MLGWKQLQQTHLEAVAESLLQFAAVLRGQGWWLMDGSRSGARSLPLPTQGLPAGRETNACIVYDCCSPRHGLVAAKIGCLAV